MRIKDFKEHKDWYARAHYSIMSKHGQDELIYALIALTSPRKQVKANMKLAERIYYNIQKGIVWHENIKGLLPSVKTAIDHYLNTGKIRGRKTHNFYKNLLLDLDSVTIDTWQLKYLGVKKPTVTPKQYDQLVKRIKNNARKHGLKPAEYQAITWTMERLKAGFNPIQMMA